MTPSRRPAASVLALLAGWLFLAAAVEASSGELLAAVGDVGATSAVVWIRGTREGPVEVEVGERRIELRPRKADGLTAKTLLTALAPATRHRYRVRQGSDEIAGEFVTAPAADIAAKVTFLWSGDLGGGGFCRLVDGGYRIFRPMARRSADFFLFVGDTIYADVPCDKPGVVDGANFRARRLEQYRQRHSYNREDPAFKEFLRQTSVYAIWDDHEVRNDFSGTTDPLMLVGRRAFIEWWPIIPPQADPTRLYRRFRWGSLLEMFILDTRQYRSANQAPDGPGKTMLGAQQREWLVSGVTTSSATWKVVVSSVPLAIPTGRPERRDSWTNASVFGLPQDGGTGFLVERDGIVTAFREAGVKNLVFVAADVHHAELIRHRPAPGYAFHELVAGPLSATTGRPRPLDQSLGSRSIFARGGVYNFGELAIEPGLLTVRFVDDAGDVLFTHTIGAE
ncbi:MAG: alkaline phosphatase D family protein [Candidatus Rokuibacteriota bacterium]